MQSSNRYNIYENNNNNNDDDDDDESRSSDILGDAPDDDVDDNVFDDTGPSANTTSIDNSMSDEQINTFSTDFKQSMRTDNSITPSCSSNSSSSGMVVPVNIQTRQPILSVTSNGGSRASTSMNYSPGPLHYQSQRLPSSSTFHSARESTSSSATTKHNVQSLAHSTNNVNTGHHTFSPKKIISKSFHSVNSAVAQRFPNNPYLLNKQPSLSTSSTKKLNKPAMGPPVVNRTRFNAANSSLLVPSYAEVFPVSTSIAASQHSLISTGKSSGRVQFLEQPDELGSQAKTHGLPACMANFFHFDVQSVFFNYNEIKAKKSQITSSGNMLSGASAASKNNMNDSTNRNYSSASQFSYSSGQENQSVVNPGISPSTSDEHTLIKSKVHLYLNDSPSLYSSDSPSTPNESRRAHLAPTRTSISSASIQHLTSQNCVNLVDECPFFQVEVGGDVFKGLGIIQDVSQRRLMKLNSLSILNKENINYKPNVVESMDMSDHETFPIEYVDWGSFFYRYYFYHYDHANYLGIDRDIGPIVISIRREKILVDYDPLAKSPSKRSFVDNANNHKTPVKERILDYVYRIIIRTSDVIIPAILSANSEFT